MRGRCYVELVNGQPVRILKHFGHPSYPDGVITEWPRVDCVRGIREAVYRRAEGYCERCGTRVTRKTGEMDEKILRSLGGEISLENSWLLCHSCHTGHPDSKHGNRRWGGRRKY